MRRTTHHHGNLRQALIDAGMDMLANGEPLTLRGAALRAGVSHAAPAHHFGGLNGLRTAIATRAMQIFAAKLAESASDPDQTPFEHLVDMGQAYCSFAAEHVELFHLMFASGEVDRGDQALLTASFMGYAQLSRVCAPFVPKGKSGWMLEHAVWSMTHGHALLQLQNPERNAQAPVWGPPLAQQYRMLLGLPEE